MVAKAVSVAAALAVLGVSTFFFVTSQKASTLETPTNSIRPVWDDSFSEQVESLSKKDDFRANIDIPRALARINSWEGYREANVQADFYLKHQNVRVSIRLVRSSDRQMLGEQLYPTLLWLIQGQDENWKVVTNFSKREQELFESPYSYMIANNQTEGLVDFLSSVRREGDFESWRPPGNVLYNHGASYWFLSTFFDGKSSQFIVVEPYFGYGTRESDETPGARIIKLSEIMEKAASMRD